MNPSRITKALAAVALGIVAVACQSTDVATVEASADPMEAAPIEVGPILRPHFLEIVTPEVDATIAFLEKTHGVEFGETQPQFGNSRTAPLLGGGRVSVRAPMHAMEKSVVRPYMLVDDIEAAVRIAVDAGAEVALPPMPIEGEGTFAIWFLGGIEHGVWQM